MPRKTTKIPQDYTIGDIMDQLQISKKTALRLVNTKQLEAYRVGKMFRITQAALHKFKQERIVSK